MIHFRILIPSRNPRGYMRRFESTRQNNATNHKVLEDVSAVLRWARAGCARWKDKCYNFVTTPQSSDRDSGSNTERSMVVRVTERERATILAALRRWLSYPAAREADATATNRGKHKPLDDGEIQRLCKRIIEMARNGNAAPLRRHSNNGVVCRKIQKTAG